MSQLPIVLVADDEPDKLQYLTQRLSRRGLQVVGVNSGQAAIQYLTTNRADIAIIDVRMPEKDGIETMEIIKLQYCPRMPIILMDDNATVDSSIQGMAGGAYDYLVKPLGLDLLLSTIRKTLATVGVVYSY